MKISRDKYPIVECATHGSLTLPITPMEQMLLQQELKVLNGVLLMKPKVDFLCYSQWSKVPLMYGRAGYKGLSACEGILLYDGISIVYKVRILSGGVPAIDIFYFDGKRLCFHMVAKEVMGEIISNCKGLHMPEEEQAMYISGLVVGYVQFLKHMQVRDKVISVNGRRCCKTLGGKVKTDFAYPINVVDETYYTNITMTAAFPVRGHDRKLGNGRIVKVRPHEKLGYSRRARKLLNAA